MPDENFRLSLYVTATSPRSARAIVNVRTLCDQHLGGHYELDVIDVTRDPTVARGNQLLALPTLIKRLPLPERRFVGDMSNLDRLVRGLGLSLAAADLATAEPAHSAAGATSDAAAD